MTSPSPKFGRPPVSEVALGVYFSPPLALRSVHLGLLWERWKDRYPASEDQTPLPPLVAESFTRSPFMMPLQLVGALPGVRTWFLAADGALLVQVQPDRLVLNWRKIGDRTYPGYATLRPELALLLRELMQFMEAEALGPALIHQCEVTFVNPVPAKEVGPPAHAEELLSAWTGSYSDDFLPPAEDAAVSLRFRIPHPETAEPIGRLYTQSSQIVMPVGPDGEGEEIFLLRVFARGVPLGDGPEGALRFLDVGHDWVVRGFASLTTPAMHRTWDRRDGDLP